MSVSNLLDIASTGLNAQQMALNVAGENVTNVNTAGYSRQSVVFDSVQSTSTHGFPLGNGVLVAAIQRNYDSFLQSQMMAANSASGNATTSNSAMGMVQPLFSDLTASGLGTSLQSFFNSWHDLAANAGGIPERQVVLSSAQQLVTDFNNISNNLTDVKDSMNTSLKGVVTDINDQLQQIAKLNGTIKQAEISGATANELRDQRDLLLRQLSGNVGVNTQEQPDGTLNVSLKNGELLVTGTTAGKLMLQPQAAPPNYSDIIAIPPGTGAATTVTGTIGGPNNSLGKLGATIQMRDVTVNSYLATLDQLASTVATEVNNVFATGYDLNGVTGGSLFSPAPPASVTAANLSLSISNPSDIAAADAAPATGGTGNNVIGLKIAALYDAKLTLPGGSMTMAEFYDSLVGKVGVDAQASQRAETSSTGTLNQMNNLRESNSGVSLDEELSNLVKYQKAYQGAAKLVNVANDMLDAVLGLVR